MKIYWSKELDDYVFQGWFNDSPKDYHVYAYCIHESFLICLPKDIVAKLEYIGEVK